jgi:hypothetical protein
MGKRVHDFACSQMPGCLRHCCMQLACSVGCLGGICGRATNYTMYVLYAGRMIANHMSCFMCMLTCRSCSSHGVATVHCLEIQVGEQLSIAHTAIHILQIVLCWVSARQTHTHVYMHGARTLLHQIKPIRGNYFKAPKPSDSDWSSMSLRWSWHPQSWHSNVHLGCDNFSKCVSRELHVINFPCLSRLYAHRSCPLHGSYVNRRMCIVLLLFLRDFL